MWSRAEQEALRLEQERVIAENERRMQQDRAEKEALASKLQAMHRGRAARRAAKEEADARHEDCEVRQKVHKKSTEGPVDEWGGDMFDKKKDKDYSSADDNVVADRSLFCLGEESGVRHTFNEVLDHKATQAFIMGCILVNVAILAVETPTSTFDEDTKSTLHTVDLLLSLIFSSKHDAATPNIWLASSLSRVAGLPAVEMVMRIIALGLVMHETAYLRTSWNVLDFVVVISIWIGWATQTAGGHEAEEGNISYLRTARALRPLRSLRMFGGIKKIMSSMFQAKAMILNVTCLILFFFVAFAAFGLSLYHGATSRACLDANTTLSIANGLPETINLTLGVDYEECPTTMQCDGTEAGLCEKVQYEFTGDLPDEIYSYGFDNARNAIMTIFIATTLDEWPQLADPIRSAPLMAHWTVWGFYALVVLICGMLGTNLFVAVVTFAFANVADTEDGTSAFAKGQVYNTAVEDETEGVTANPVADTQVLASPTFDTEESPSRMFDSEAPPRKSKPGVPIIRKVVEHSYFEAFILLIVVLNTAALAGEHYDPEYHDQGGMSKEFSDGLHLVELVFTGIYCIELVMKQLGLGPKEYFSSGFNCLDFFLVATTLLSFAVKDLKGFGAGSMFRILRLFRAARLVRLIRKYPAVRKLLSTVTKSWAALLNVLFFITVWLVIFAVMGIHLYGHDNEVFNQDGIPRDNFQNFPRSLLTCFIVLTGEDWSPLMYNFIRAYGWNVAVFFVFMFLMTNFVLANLFVAVILENFSVDEDQKMEVQKRKYEADQKRRMKMGAPLAFEDQPDDTPFIRDLLCPQQDLHYCPDHCFLRQWCSTLVEDARFDKFIIVIIILSSLCLGIEGPPDAEYLRDYDGVRSVLEILDVCFFFIFWLECVCKIIAHGFLLTRGAYLTDGWNQLDFSIVVLTTVDFILRYCESCTGDYTWVKVFRVARVMRPLRVATKFENIKVIVDALLSAMGGVVSVLALAGFLFLVFSIIGLNLFAGKFWMCQEEGFEMLNRTECMSAGYEWANPDQHFDNIWHSLEALFVTATLEGWVEIMNRGMDVPDEVGMAPVEGVYPAHGVYFVIFTILASFFITNLFIGVLVNNFQQSTGSSIMTDEQQQWAQFQMLLAMSSLETTEKEAAAQLARAKPYQRNLLPIVNDHKFEIGISIVVGLNMVVLLSEHFPQTEAVEAAIDTANFVFLILFTIEMLMQLAARGPSAYFKSTWYLMDFFVISLSWVLTFSEVQAGQNAARALRMLRVLLILKFAKMARSMVMTVILSLGPAVNVIAVLILILYVYAVAGMQFYGNLEECEKINDLENFRNIFTSMMFLFQISTGQDFKSIMFDIRAQDGFAVGAFFISFYVLSIFVFINLFVAVLLEAFEREFDDSIQLDLTTDDLTGFKNEWDGECESLLSQGLVEPKSGCCGKSTNKSMPVRHLRDFIERLPPESAVGEARGLGNQIVWWNRVLHELSIQSQCSLYGVEPASIHEAEQGQADAGLLDRLIAYSEVVRACNLMRKAVQAAGSSDALAMLTYGERVELQEKLDEARIKCAHELLRASVNAWKMIRHPPPEVAERIAADPNEQRIWNLQVRFRPTDVPTGGSRSQCRQCNPLTTRLCVHVVQVVIARTLMITTIIQREKVG
jgi:hypothetical protein